MFILNAEADFLSLWSSLKNSCYFQCHFDVFQCVFILPATISSRITNFMLLFFVSFSYVARYYHINLETVNRRPAIWLVLVVKTAIMKDGV